MIKYKDKLQKYLNKERDTIIDLGTYKPKNPDNLIDPQNKEQVKKMIEKNVGIAFSTNDVASKNASNIKTFSIILSDSTDITPQNEITLKKYYEQVLASNVIAMINNSVIEVTPDMKEDKGRVATSAVDKLIRQANTRNIIGEKFKTNSVSAEDIFKDIPIMNATGFGKMLDEEYKKEPFDGSTLYGDYSAVDRAGFAIDTNSILPKFLASQGKVLVDRHRKIYDKAKDLYEKIEKIEDKIKDLGNIHEFRKKQKELHVSLAKELDEIVLAKPAITTTASYKTYESMLASTMNMSAPIVKDDFYQLDIYREYLLRDSGVITSRAKENRSDLSKLIDEIDKITSTPEEKARLPKYKNDLAKYEQEMEDLEGFIADDFESFRAEEIKRMITEKQQATTEDEDPYVRYLGINTKDTVYSGRYGGNPDSRFDFVDRFKDKRTKLEFRVACDLLLNAEILPDEFIEYVRKDLKLPLTAKTESSIKFKFGDGSPSNPYRLFNTYYETTNKQGVLRLAQIISGMEYQKDLKHRTFKRAYKEIKSNRAAKNSHDVYYRLISVFGGGARRVARMVENTINDNKKNVDKAIKDQIFSTDTAFKLDVVSKPIEKANEFISKLDQYKTAEEAMKDFDFSKNNIAGKIPGLDDLDELYTVSTGFKTLFEEVEKEYAEDKINLQEVFGGGKHTITLSKPIEVKAVNTYNLKNKQDETFIIPAYTIGNQLLYGQVEVERDANKERRYNEPIWLKIRFVERYSMLKNDAIDNTYTATIGIKANISRVPSSEVEYVFKSNAEKVSFKPADILGKIKSDSQLSRVWSQAKSIKNVLGSETFNNNFNGAAVLSPVIIASTKEATTNIAETADFNYIKKPELAVKLMNKYNAGAICLIDPIQEIYYLIDNENESWDRVPFSELEQNKKQNIDLTSLQRLR